MTGTLVLKCAVLSTVATHVWGKAIVVNKRRLCFSVSVQYNREAHSAQHILKVRVYFKTHFPSIFYSWKDQITCIHYNCVGLSERNSMLHVVFCCVVSYQNCNSMELLCLPHKELNVSGSDCPGSRARLEAGKKLWGCFFGEDFPFIEQRKVIGARGAGGAGGMWGLSRCH